MRFDGGCRYTPHSGSLQTKLSKYEDATTFFDSINPSSMRFALKLIKLAKGDQTRKSWMEKIAKLAAVGEKLNGS